MNLSKRMTRNDLLPLPRQVNLLARPEGVGYDSQAAAITDVMENLVIVVM